jgi:hypothetical protein
VGITSGGQHASEHTNGMVAVPDGHILTQLGGWGPRRGHGMAQPGGRGSEGSTGQNTWHVLGLRGPGLPSGQVGTISSIGALVGKSVGGSVGLAVGVLVGDSVGPSVGNAVGISVVGKAVGISVVGDWVGLSVGPAVGAGDGAGLGAGDGLALGVDDGCGVGS